MKKLYFILGASFLTMTSCQSTQNSDNQSTQKLTEEAIRIHDEIMPQIGNFDRTTVKIDSILDNLAALHATTPTLDTAVIKADLTTLKSNLESATDNMMTWMKEYNPDSTDVAYQQAEIDKVTAMKKQFEDVSVESNKKLSSF